MVPIVLFAGDPTLRNLTVNSGGRFLQIVTELKFIVNLFHENEIQGKPQRFKIYLFVVQTSYHVDQLPLNYCQLNHEIEIKSG